MEALPWGAALTGPVFPPTEVGGPAIDPLALSLGVKTMQNVGGVAWWAHAAGFIGGLLLGPALARKKTNSRR